jgi:hypothetical protein
MFGSSIRTNRRTIACHVFDPIGDPRGGRLARAAPCQRDSRDDQPSGRPPRRCVRGAFRPATAGSPDPPACARLPPIAGRARPAVWIAGAGPHSTVPRAPCATPGRARCSPAHGRRRGTRARHPQRACWARERFPRIVRPRAGSPRVARTTPSACPAVGFHILSRVPWNEGVRTGLACNRARTPGGEDGSRGAALVHPATLARPIGSESIEVR